VDANPVKASEQAVVAWGLFRELDGTLQKPT
jgi:hypothetical protein